MKLFNFFEHLRLSTVIIIMMFSLVVVFSSTALCTENGELLLGIEPEHNIFDQVERYRALSSYLSDRLEVPVKLTVMSRYGEIMKRFKSLRLDGAFLSSYTAVMSINELGLEPVASPVAIGTESHSHGYILVRKDSGIKTIDDMQGKSMVFVDPASAEGYIFPLSQLGKHGVTDPGRFFSRSYFSGSHASAIYAVLDSRVDIGAAKDSAYIRLVNKDPTIGDELSVIASSPEVPETTLCVRSDLDADLRQRLDKVLLNLDKTDKGKDILNTFGALRFIKTGKADFSNVAVMAREAGIQLMDPGSR